MDQLFVGVAQVSLYLRHAQTLKDKRQVLKSILNKLKNVGFSVTECARLDDPKQASIGATFVGTSHEYVKQTMDDALRQFVGDFEVLREQRDIFNYSDVEVERSEFEFDPRE